MEAIARSRRFCAEFNLFESDTTDIESIYAQRWSTRLYTVILLLSMSALIVYNGLSVNTQLMEIQSPTFELYLKLQQAHADLYCPCAEVSASYRSIVTLTPIHHPICSSDFVSQKWIDMLVDNMTALRYSGDFRTSASSQFQVLRELCNRSKSVLNKSIESFYDNKFVSGYLLTESRLHVDTKLVIDAVQASSSTSFSHPIALLRSFMVGNMLVSGIGMAGQTYLFNSNGEYGAYFQVNNYVSPQHIDECTCDNSDICSVPAAFYDYVMIDQYAAIIYGDYNPGVLFAINGWFVGCWALGSLLVSSFTDGFLYNKTALDLIAASFNWSSDATLPTVLSRNDLNQTDNSNRTFNELLQNLFVIDILTEIDYIPYFTQCQPKTCYYSIEQHQSLWYVFILLLALYGGLTVVLRFLIPYVVSFVIQHLRCQNVVHVNIGKFQARFFRTATVFKTTI